MIRFLFVVLLLVAVACSPQPTATIATTSQPEIEPTEEPFYAWDFTMSSLSGQTYTLSDLRGQWVIINFWATWCVPCVEEMPALQEIANLHADKLILLGINQREDADLVAEFAHDHNITFPLLLNPDDATLANYQVLKTPQTIIVDPNGELVWRQFGPIELENFDETLISLFEEFD